MTKKGVIEERISVYNVSCLRLLPEAIQLQFVQCLIILARTFEENWLQLEEPPEVAFVSISGDATVTVDKDRTINSLTIGANRWDRTQLVLDQDLRVCTPSPGLDFFRCQTDTVFHFSLQ